MFSTLVTIFPRRCRAVIGKIALLFVFACRFAWAQDQAATGDSEKSTEADKAWREVVKAGTPPPPPAEWSTNHPSHEDISNFYGPLVIKAADKARDFYTRFPDHTNAAGARKREFMLLQKAIVDFGVTNQAGRLVAARTVLAKDPGLSEEERFVLRSQAVQMAAANKKDQGREAEFAELEKGARELQKEFPNQPDVYMMLLQVAFNSGPEKLRGLAKEIMDSPAPDSIKLQAKSLSDQLSAVGKPVDIKFTAVDGREVDVTKMPGKVVLIDFWATWCAPCVAELPNVKAAYDKLHARGFEIVGISFDQEKDALASFVSDKKMTWAQYFDGKGWQNKFGQQFGIGVIPTMWLVDKKGNLRDVAAGSGLEDKVAKLLDEP
ncbi:MAG TPA: TlpA disulfide reductase family protein [Verrucomicrobiae bacterium]|nr:TlpA disulfide reductase family protein [Verrucomicrobiae bacterium]